MYQVSVYLGCHIKYDQQLSSANSSYAVTFWTLTPPSMSCSTTEQAVSQAICGAVRRSFLWSGVLHILITHRQKHWSPSCIFMLMALDVSRRKEHGEFIDNIFKSGTT